MREIRHFIGIDPGPIPGIVMLTPKQGGRSFEVDVIQCTARTAPVVLWALLDQARSVNGQAPALVAIERFVVRRRAGVSSTPEASEITRDLIGRLQSTAADQPNVSVVLRTASEVKPWATVERLAWASLLNPTTGMRHARDAARHALFAAVKDGRLPDPLSNKNWSK